MTTSGQCFNSLGQSFDAASSRNLTATGHSRCGSNLTASGKSFDAIESNCQSLTATEKEFDSTSSQSLTHRAINRLRLGLRLDRVRSKFYSLGSKFESLGSKFTALSQSFDATSGQSNPASGQRLASSGPILTDSNLTFGAAADPGVSGRGRAPTAVARLFRTGPGRVKFPVIRVREVIRDSDDSDKGP